MNATQDYRARVRAQLAQSQPTPFDQTINAARRVAAAVEAHGAGADQGPRPQGMEVPTNRRAPGLSGDDRGSFRGEFQNPREHGIAVVG